MDSIFGSLKPSPDARGGPSRPELGTAAAAERSRQQHGPTTLMAAALPSVGLHAASDRRNAADERLQPAMTRELFGCDAGSSPCRRDEALRMTYALTGIISSELKEVTHGD